MFARHFTGKEMATMLLNESNPKTMDYFFVKLLGVKLDNARVNYNGSVSGSLRSYNNRITEAVGTLTRVRGVKRGQLYFILDAHDHQIFPKSRSLRICSRKYLPVSVVNPKAGETKKVMYGSYSHMQTEGPEITIAKSLVLYCRNAWERKGEVLPSRATVKEVPA